MGWDTVRDDLTWSEYTCLLAEALDAEELEDYNLTTLLAVGFHNPKALKRWRWSSIDKAGTVPLGRVGIANEMAKFAGTLSGGQIPVAPSGFIYERAKATGRPIIYMDGDGNYFDEQGRPAERTSLALVVRMEDEVQH